MSSSLFFSFILSLGVEITLQSQSLVVCYSSPLSKLLTFSDTQLRLQQVETCLELLSYYGKGRKKSLTSAGNVKESKMAAGRNFLIDAFLKEYADLPIKQLCSSSGFELCILGLLLVFLHCSEHSEPMPILFPSQQDGRVSPQFSLLRRSVRAAPKQETKGLMICLAGRGILQFV